jgi:hypothetical protein
MLVRRSRLLGYTKIFFIRWGNMASCGVRRYAMAARAPATDKLLAFVIFSFGA